MDRSAVFSKDNLGAFFDILTDFGKLFAPVRVSEQSFAFRQVETPDEVAFDALRTILPPKKFFFKQEEELISYKGSEIKAVEPRVARQVLFGIHPCDLAGLGIMDEIYHSEPADLHYVERRKATLVVGLDCMPDKHCFCDSMGTDSPERGYDLFLTDIGDEYYVQIHNEAGQEIVDSAPDTFYEATAEHLAKSKKFWADRAEAFTCGFKSTNLKAVMDAEWDSQMWEDLGNRCLSCGNCTPVCPTCYCFDVFDVPSLHSDEGKRVRQWDSCQFVGFAQVAGDFNFRPGPVDRLKFWYRHKLHGFDDPYGLPTCVGCGRCTVSCPSGIDDIVNVVLRMQGKPSILITDKGEPDHGKKEG